MSGGTVAIVRYNGDTNKVYSSKVLFYFYYFPLIIIILFLEIEWIATKLLLFRY